MLALFLTISLLISPQEQTSLYKALDPHSLDAHIAYWQLFKESPEGKRALQKAWGLLGLEPQKQMPLNQLPYNSLNQLTNVVLSHAKPELFDETSLAVIETLCHKLPNRKLKGYQAKTLDEVLALSSEEIDIAHALFIAQGIEDSRSYEASLDLLALKALAKLQAFGGLDATPESKIEAINQLLFFDLGMRYPPLSDENVDRTSSLALVLDSNRGICLGTSFVYLALADRLGLNLESVTPPGHIYVRGKSSQGERINIETTARGVNVADRHYLSINVKFLKVRTRKETVGLIFSNEGGLYIRKQDFTKAAMAYQKASLFVKDDPLLTQLQGLSLLLSGQKKEGRACLEKALLLTEESQIDNLTLAEDALKLNLDEEALSVYLLEIKPSKQELLDKQKRLKNVLKRFPAFKEGLLEMANLSLQLQRPKEAIDALLQYHKIKDDCLQAEFMLGILYMERVSYQKAEKHLKNVQAILAKHNQKSREFESAWQQLSLYITPI